MPFGDGLNKLKTVLHLLHKNYSDLLLILQKKFLISLSMNLLSVLTYLPVNSMLEVSNYPPIPSVSKTISKILLNSSISEISLFLIGSSIIFLILGKTNKLLLMSMLLELNTLTPLLLII